MNEQTNNFFHSENSQLNHFRLLLGVVHWTFVRWIRCFVFCLYALRQAFTNFTPQKSRNSKMNEGTNAFCCSRWRQLTLIGNYRIGTLGVAKKTSMPLPASGSKKFLRMFQIIGYTLTTYFSYKTKKIWMSPRKMTQSLANLNNIGT